MTAERDVNDERQEFLERRMSGLGATDSPKILGLSRYGTALTVYRDKVDPQPDEQSLPAWLGLKLQNTVAELYTAASGIRVRADNRHHRHPKHDWMVCHLDFRAWGKPGLLVECKTKAHMTGFGEDGTTRIPAEIWVQVQHEMAVTGADTCHVAVLFGHHTFRVYPIARDDHFIETLIPRLEAFWYGNVIAKVPPLPTGHSLDGAEVRREHPHTDNDAPLKPATPEQEQVVRQLVIAENNAAATKLAAEDLKNKVIRLIGDAPGIEGSFGRITYRKDKDRTTTDWEAVAATQSNVIEELLLIANPGDDDELVSRLARAQAVIGNLPGLYQSTREGSRRFLTYFTEED